MNPVPCSDGLHFRYSLGSDRPSSLREGLQSALQRKRDAFEQTSMDPIGERMPVQNSMKIRYEREFATDLPQTSEKDFRTRHLRARRQILRVARIANDCVRRDPAQQKRGGGQPPAADDDVSLRGELLGRRR